MSTEHTNPPIPDYEGLPLGSIEHRIRSLDLGQMRELVAYEREHANRPNVLQILERRLGELEQGAEPSGGAQDFHPETPSGPRGGSSVGPDSAAPPHVPQKQHNPKSQ